MPVGFQIFARDDKAEFHVEDHGHKDRPALVTLAAAPGARLALIGRLYYRDDLRAGLELAAPELRDGAEDDDAALALAVYRQRGLEGLERLEGDFALIIWDAGERRLVGMRAPTGGYPIFYAARQGAIRAGTSMGPLLDSLAGRTLNQEYLADYLMMPGWDMEEPADGRTVYQGIRRVLSGSIAVFHLTSGSVEQRCYWDWLERQVDPGTDDVAKIGEQYLDRLRGAVRTRLRGRSASHLSGGMDSTSVALIARDCLQGVEPLHTLSLVHERLPQLARERPYLEAALKQPGLVPHRIDADDILDFDCFATAPAHDEPCPWLYRVGFDQATIAAAARAGVTTVMTGFGADEIFYQQPFHLAELLRSGRPWAAWREASRWARAKNCNVWEMLGLYGVTNLQPAWMHMGAGSWLRGGYAPWGRHNEWTIAPWIRPDFARRLGLRERSLANVRRTYHASRSVGLSLILSLLRQSSNDFSRVHLAAPHGMMLTHPFRDQRVFSLGIGIQSRTRPQPHPGVPKPILAAAMRGILPECILKRPFKGDFNEAYYLGLSRNLNRLEDLIEQAPADEMDFLDKSSLLDCLQRAALGNAANVGAVGPLNRTLSLLLWMTREHKGRLQQRPPGPAPQEHADAAPAAA